MNEGMARAGALAAEVSPAKAGFVQDFGRDPTAYAAGYKCSARFAGWLRIDLGKHSISN